MNRNNELLAVKSSGISIYFLVKPAVFSGFVLASAIFLMGEILVPISMVKARHIEYNVIRHQKNISQNRENIWIRSDEKLIHFNYYDPMKKSANDITIVYMGDSFQPESRFDAQKGYYKNGEWIFENIIQQTYNPGTGDYDVTIFQPQYHIHSSRRKSSE